ncbi:tail fiber domain-containing protein [Flexithrix dorotheae]|uniref:tail fiber domain-containing protein n=1 Tax=Flexithrix dorotheae TaxID=70993 RepID=UPI00036AC692|nr:tail fiber domain-containing protein [Flexithrix dorotheae]
MKIKKAFPGFLICLLFNFAFIYSAFSQNNTSYGAGAGSSLSTGSSNAMFGINSGKSTTVGSNNTFLGTGSGINNTSGSDNVSIGLYSGGGNTTGNKNVSIGNFSGYLAQTANYNVSIGFHAGQSNVSGKSNVCIGYFAGLENTAAFNTFLGTLSGKNNSTGSKNTFLGKSSGESNTTGSFNTFSGYYSGFDNTIGYGNTFSGYASGRNNKYGNYNTFLGYHSGYWNQNGSYNVCLGYGAGLNELGSNKLYIAKGADPLIYGNFVNKTVSINTKYTGSLYALSVAGTIHCDGLVETSDERFKQNIHEIDSSLIKLQQLKGVSYQFKREAYQERKLPKGDKIGLLAQDVRKVFPQLVIEDEEGYLAVNYTGMIPVLVEAVKALSSKQDSIGNYQKRIEKLESEIAELKVLMLQMNTSSNKRMGNLTSESEFSLGQNSPNPFNGQTTINFQTPIESSSIAIVMYNQNGEVVMQFNNLQTGKGQVEVDISHLTKGVYLYSLIVNGEKVETKRMLLEK